MRIYLKAFLYGGIAGGALLLVLIVVIIVVCLMRRRRRRRRGGDKQIVSNDSGNFCFIYLKNFWLIQRKTKNS